jgi:hypothetical protein
VRWCADGSFAEDGGVVASAKVRRDSVVPGGRKQSSSGARAAATSNSRNLPRRWSTSLVLLLALTWLALARAAHVVIDIFVST